MEVNVLFCGKTNLDSKPGVDKVLCQESKIVIYTSIKHLKQFWFRMEVNVFGEN